MSLIDNKDRDFLMEWGSENRDRTIFDKKSDTSQESYYHTRNKVSGIYEYEIKNISDILEKFDSGWTREHNSQMKKRMAVLVMKAGSEIQEKNQADAKEKKIPDFTYTF